MTKSGAQNISRRRWFVLASCVYIQFICAGSMSANGLYMVEFLKTFDESTVTLSWMFTILYLTGAIFTPVAGYLTSIYGTRKVVAVGAIIMTFASGAIAFIDSLVLLFLTFSILFGSGAALVYVSSMPIIADYFTDRYALANGITWVGGGLGTMIVPPLVEALIQVYGWHGTFLIISGLCANNFVCALIMKPVTKTAIKQDKEPSEKQSDTDSLQEYKSESNESINSHSNRVHGPDGYTSVQETEKSTDDAIDAEHQGDRQASSNKTARSSIFSVIYRMWGFYIFPKYPRITVLVVCMIGFGAAMITYYMWIIVRAVDIGIPRMQAAALMTAFGVSSVIGRLCHGWFVDRKLILPMALLASMLMLNAISILIYNLVTSYVIMVIACVGIGLSHGVCLPMFIVCTREIVRLEDLPSAIGLIFSTNSICGGLVLTFAGKLYDDTGDSKMPLFVAAMFCGSAAVICTMAVCVNRYRSRR
ncbi:monocarboxylate transporter 12-like [Ptychodera flava]|uniref:monocarboxylate transporter 12-like n=1 Tax=Ptychodera flava TaxID=63121 RepID=UPI00396A4023